MILAVDAGHRSEIHKQHQESQKPEKHVSREIREPVLDTIAI